MEGYSGCTDLTQATERLVFVLVSRIQKSGTRDNNFVKWKGTFRSDRPDRSKLTTFKAGPEYPGRTKPKWSVPFDVPPEISREPTSLLVEMVNNRSFARRPLMASRNVGCSFGSGWSVKETSE